MFSVGGDFRGVSIRIFTSFSGVSFNVLMHQDECLVGSGIFSVSFTSILDFSGSNRVVVVLCYSPTSSSWVWLALMARI